ncbi:MAG: hypothetical protein WC933_02855 [Candidatus Paceibacterota bacterium]|jgi:hypothetical protein
MEVTIEIESQTGTSTGPAKITVKHGLKIVAEIMGEVKFMKGADGGMYPRVELTNITKKE